MSDERIENVREWNTLMSPYAGPDAIERAETTLALLASLESLRAENARLAGMLEHEGASHMAALDGWNKAEASLIAATAEVERLRELCNRARNCLMARPRPPAVLIEQLRLAVPTETDDLAPQPGSESQKKGDG